ncbi:16S rRNA (guanine(966)-N(2))-methyltransferase RsmD [Brevibacillus sp. SYSU BS000544]|uniref:16S rRNA (guanine(966)-N(2))-methyltransferase RsmD n=1 Tax=Brevibacillus sp. SYSU BS000544 TaxID=3416443 RepID=UPI003CE4A9D4
MRIIAGDFKGRPLSAVPGKGTRPTTDKVRESIFNIIGPYFEGGTVLDLYAGTGGLGIEALSRGIEKAVFIDIDPKAISVIKENLSSFKLDNQVEVFRTDSHRALKALTKRELQFDLVFLDPPYAKQKIAEEIQLLQDYNLLAPDAQIVTEHDASVVLPESIGTYAKVRFVTYGDTTVSIFERIS